MKKLHPKIIFITIAVLVVIGYAYSRTHTLIAGPILIIQTPQNGSTVTSAFITVAGNTTNVNEITLNDRPIFTDETGVIREGVLLSRGYNVLELEASDKLGRKVTKIIELVRK